MNTDTQNQQAYQILCAMRLRPTPFAIFVAPGKKMKLMRTDRQGYPAVLRERGSDLVGVYTAASSVLDVLADIESVTA